MSEENMSEDEDIAAALNAAVEALIEEMRQTSSRLDRVNLHTRFLEKHLSNFDLVNQQMVDFFTRLLERITGTGLLSTADIQAATQIAAKNQQWVSALTLDIEEGTTELMRACGNGCIGTARRLLAAGAAVDEQRADGRTALMLAAFFGQLEALALLHARKADLSYVKADGGTVLMQACQSGEVPCARWLLDRGCKPDQAKHDGSTALHVAASHKRSEVVKLLCRFRADVNHKKDDQTSPLIYACKNRDLASVSTLLEYGAHADPIQFGDMNVSLLSAMLEDTPSTDTLAIMRLLLEHCRSAFDGFEIKEVLQHALGLLHRQPLAEGDDGLVDTILAASDLGINTWVSAARGDQPMPLLDAACSDGALAAVHLLSARGAERHPPHTAEAWGNDETWDAADESSAEQHSRDQARPDTSVHDFLVRSREWRTELHHVSTLSARRVRQLLRAGADPHATGRTDATLTPLVLAERWLVKHLGKPWTRQIPAAVLVVRAAQPWSPRNHFLFPLASRVLAGELLLVGHILARVCEPGFLDVWMEFIMPMSVTRPSEVPQQQRDPTTTSTPRVV